MTRFRSDWHGIDGAAPGLDAGDALHDSGKSTELISTEEQSLRSFIFEVSAGRPQGVVDATTLEIRVDPPQKGPRARRRRPSRERLQEARAAKAEASPEKVSTSTGGTNETLSVRPQPRRDIAAPQWLPGSQPSANLTRTAKVRRLKPRGEKFSATCLSACINGLFVFGLLACRLPGIEPLQELLLSIAAAPEELEFTEVNLEPTPEDPPVDGQAEAPSDLLDPGAASFGDLESSAALADVGANADLPTGALDGELGALFGDQGAGLTTFDSGVGDAPLAKFFGQEIEGRRIVFVLDNSGSMQGGRLETVITELLRCVESLREDQEFYVMFHSDTVYPLFYPDGVDRYIRPTPANKRMLMRWLETVELCLGDSVDDALAIAAMIEPDTVFLLSDGRIQGDKKIRFLLDGQSRNFPIHTFAVGMGGSVAGRRNLADVAAANRGEFRESEIPDEMKQLAREKLRPYHSERPGPVWGRQVKPFRPRG